MRVIKSDRLSIKSWCSEPESGAIVQARHVAELPFSVHHVALLPDTHQGYGMPIGCVLATENDIIPNAVGVDIGCGVLQGKVSLSDTLTQDQLKFVMGRIRERIPVGFNKLSHPVKESSMPTLYSDKQTPIVYRELDNAMKSLGTLGGGNHFIEIQKMEGGLDENYYVMIHSGSRNLGKQVCDFYNKAAEMLNETWHVGYPPSWDLAFLPAEDNIGQAYLDEMDYCVRFAQLNRLEMIYKVFQIFNEIPGITMTTPEVWKDTKHNYALREFHFGRMLWIHRKGAVNASKNKTVLIPGSQGTASYRGTGLGNPDSFESCSHGAGRKMSRGDARRNLDLAVELAMMEKMGIIHGIRTAQDLDEAPGSYKDIDIVMKEQSDLVEIEAKFNPIAVIKG